MRCKTVLMVSRMSVKGYETRCVLILPSDEARDRALIGRWPSLPGKAKLVASTRCRCCAGCERPGDPYLRGGVGDVVVFIYTSPERLGQFVQCEMLKDGANGNLGMLLVCHLHHRGVWKVSWYGSLGSLIYGFRAAEHYSGWLQMERIMLVDHVVSDSQVQMWLLTASTRAKRQSPS